MCSKYLLKGLEFTGNTLMPFDRNLLVLHKAFTLHLCEGRTDKDRMTLKLNMNWVLKTF